jgi:N-carbamoyl-L-amino-acid hydrolase
MQPLTINAERLWTRLMRLAEIGATERGGVDRQALTDGEADAWRLVIGWAEAAGLEASTDAAANLFLTLPGQDRALAPVMAGSHLDSQPTGGKFDGAFGVMAALEVAVSLSEAGSQAERDFVVVAWMNEEGSRFAPGMMGSGAFVGWRSIEAIRSVRDAAGTTVGAEIDRLLYAFPDLPRRSLGWPLHSYIEPHIEQYTLLEQADCVIGAVTGIQGKETFNVVIDGEKGHAGTLVMKNRKDAAVAFAHILSALQATIGSHDPQIKFTVGRVVVEPNAPSVVASRVSFSIDLRHPDNVVLDRCGAIIQPLCQAHAGACSVAVEALVSAASNDFDAHLQALILDSAANRSFATMSVLSYAGHDARQLSAVCPSAMIFIPCLNGISHDEAERAEASHVSAGALVLLDVVLHQLAIR